MALEDRKTLRSFLLGGARQMVSLLPNLVIYPLIARMLGDADFGAWTLIGAAGFMLILSDAGLSTAVRRAAVTDDHALARRTLGLALLTITAVLPFAIVAMFHTMLTFRDVGPRLGEEAFRASAVMMIGGSLGALANPFMDFVYARGGAAQVARTRVIGATVQIAIIVSGFVWKPMLLIPAAASSVNSLIQLVLLAREARRHDPELPLLPRLPTDKAEALRAYRDGFAQLSINASVVMALRIDYKVLEWAATKHALADGMSARDASHKALELVGKYGIAGLAVDMSYMIAKQANTALMRSLGRNDERTSAFRVGTTIFSGLIVSGMAAIIFAGQPFIVLLLGDKAEGVEVYTILHLLGAAAMILSTYEVAGQMVMLSAKTAWACAIPYMCGALVNLFVSVTFAPVAPLYGIVAVAGSTAIGNCVAAVLLWRQAVRIVEWSWRDAWGVFFPIVMAASTSIAVAVALGGVANSGPWQSLGVSLVVTLTGVTAMALTVRRSWQKDAA
ncbi:MAG: polysaccharide biosynthesis C-terminal domain-containing protein [Polyangiales bacterium]|nr:polysaccharide biosynthesis C-terminal domain-containing protein [Myxococcales bacterium]